MNYLELIEKLKRNEDLRDEGLTPPDNVDRFNNIAYGEDPFWQSLDIYRPKGNDDYLPVIVSVHGGGWVYGDKERYQYYCMSLVQHGFAVVNYTYRVAPESKFPASIEDTNTVFQWILDHNETYKLDTNNIFGVGDSAGGHILGLYANILTNTNYRKQFNLDIPQNLQLNAIALNCSVSEIRTELEMFLMKELLPEKGTEKEFDTLNVAKYITSDFPPSFIMTCSKDFLKKDASLLSKSLMKQNVPFQFHFFGTNEILLTHCFHLDMKNKYAHICNKKECEFFKEYIK